MSRSRSNAAVAAIATETAANTEPDVDGWFRLTIPLESVTHGAAALLGLGTDVEVLEPDALREHIARTAAVLVARYA